MIRSFFLAIAVFLGCGVLASAQQPVAPFSVPPSHVFGYTCTFASATTCAVTMTTQVGNSPGQFTSATTYHCLAPDMGTATSYVGFTVGNKTGQGFTIYASTSTSDTVTGSCTGY